jgi:phenylpropionate dioxygenase-like ring-hydroxylating dioxygenase large terminal subunit
MFLRNFWYVAASSGELGRELLPRYVAGEPVVLYRTTSGAAVALADACPHRSFPLSKGRLEGDVLQCMYHGLKWDAAGKCVHIPGQPNIPPTARVKTYAVVERWNWIWVWIGDAEPDHALLPDMHWNDDPAWAPTRGYLEIRCNYQLLVDNLLDLSHAAFVHPGTIGDPVAAATPPKVWPEGEKICLERRVHQVDPPPFFSSLHGHTTKVNRLQRTVFSPPTNIVILSRCVGQDADLDQASGALDYVVLNAITPATAGVTHHFWAVNRNFRIEDQKLTEAFFDQSQKTFNEDIDVLESQQRRIDDLGGGPKWLNVVNDTAAVMARRTMERLK